MLRRIQKNFELIDNNQSHKKDQLNTSVYIYNKNCGFCT
jgi:hypothetical protein